VYTEDGCGDHYALITPNLNNEDNEKKSWFIKCVDKANQIYVLYNQKWGGPLFCGDG